VGKGYAEGPAAEERFAELERAERGPAPDEPERHFLGWVGEVDADQLFAAGEAWGLKVVRVRER
jgi:hypothetical protein